LAQRGALRKLMADPETTLVPGVTDPLTARLAEACGAQVLFSTGSGISNKWLGLPDLGMATMTEIVEMNRRIADATALPLIADADTGYGGPLNVIRTVRELESAGVAGIVLEDQTTPKRCGRFAGKQVVAPEEMLTKIRAAVTARSDDKLVLVARTDALAVEGFESAVGRARAYLAAGADMIFVEAGSSEEHIAAIPGAIDGPCMVNVAEREQGCTLTRERLQAYGYGFALHANLALHVAARSVREAFTVLLRTGSTAMLKEKMLSWDERQELAGLSHWEQLERTAEGTASGRSDPD
jgi:2-methylisocitrate lyase-like PEP mutase family enzyme